jgi:tryptophan-rich hypothetical protein
MMRAPAPKIRVLSKWTAAQPQNREKHFLVSQIHNPAKNQIPQGFVEIEAVLTKRRQAIAIHELQNTQQWLVGWV